MLDPTVLLALGFASYRATQLIVWDTIAAGARHRVELWHAAKHESRLRTFTRQLVSCPYCVGWWLSMLTTMTYLTATRGWGGAPLVVHAIECWAVAGVQAVINRWDDSRSGPDPEGD